MAYNWDMGGSDLLVNSVSVGATAPGQAGTSLSGAELTVLDGVTPGTATASKAVVLGASKNIATITSATITTLTTTGIAGGPTFSANPVLGTGTTIDLDSNTASCTGTGGTSTATMTKYACQITTASITTAAAGTHVITITATGLVASTDLVFMTRAGGTNTRKNFAMDAVCTTDTITVTITNTEPTNAFNGTIIFNIWVLKA